MSDGSSGFFKGLLIGGLAGILTGILIAPKSGKETRGQIAARAEELFQAAGTDFESAVATGKRGCGSAVAYSGEILDKMKGLAREGKGGIQEGATRLKRALDAGMQAYREEKEKSG